MTTITIERAFLIKVLDQLDIAQSLLERSQHHAKMAAMYEELRAALAAPECRPMTLAEIKLNPVISYFGVESGEKIVRAVEAFHGIKEQP